MNILSKTGDDLTACDAYNSGFPGFKAWIDGIDAGFVKYFNCSREEKIEFVKNFTPSDDATDQIFAKASPSEMAYIIDKTEAPLTIFLF